MKKLLLFILTLLYSSTLLLSVPPTSFAANCSLSGDWCCSLLGINWCNSSSLSCVLSAGVYTCQPTACGQDGATCTTPGSKGSCCVNFTCIGTGTAIPPGICKSTTNLGTLGNLCRTTTPKCDGGLTCNALNICANAGLPPGPPPGPPGISPFDGCSPTSINTALGCLDITGPATITAILDWAIGIGGGIAFLLIVFAGVQMAMASGDPKRVKASQELLTAALSGLALIILSIILLNFIGIKVLNLGGLGFQNP